MANSLLERLYGGLWGGAIGQAVMPGKLPAKLPAKSVEEDADHPELARVQQLLLWDERPPSPQFWGNRAIQESIQESLAGDWAVALEVAQLAAARSAGDWTIAFPWAMTRSPIPSATGLWLGTTLGVNGGSRAIPIALRVTHVALGIPLRSQAEVLVRSAKGIGAKNIPIVL